MPVIDNPIGLELENIVLATDCNPESQTAEQYAEALAARFYSKVTVANVVDLSIATHPGRPAVGVPIEQLEQKGEVGTQRIVDKLHEAGLRSESRIVAAHNVGSAIVDLSQQLKADLIVMGTKAQRGLGRLMLGSVAEGVIHHALCPVITVGPRVRKMTCPVLRIENIVFATDLQHDVTTKAGVALAFAKDSVAHIHVCHVLDHSGERFGDTLERQVNAENALRKSIPQPTYEWCSPKYIVESGKVGEHVLQLAKTVNADLIVLGAHRDATWFTHLSEGVVGRVVAEAECPVMTICTE